MTGHLIDLVKTTKEATFSTNVFSVFHNDLDDSEERPSYFLASPQKPTQTKEEEEQALNSFSSPPPMFSEPILSQDISTLFSQSQSYPLSPPQALKRTLSISDQEDENQSENPPVITTYKIKRKTVYFIILFLTIEIFFCFFYIAISYSCILLFFSISSLGLFSSSWNQTIYNKFYSLSISFHKPIGGFCGKYYQYEDFSKTYYLW